MKFNKTPLEGLLLIEPEPHEDPRGLFMRIYCAHELENAGSPFVPVQLSVSVNKLRGTIRGMHFQTEPKAEAKMVRCLRGAIYDVNIDIRPDSPTYGKWFATELNEKNRNELYIPKGFAHGYQTLADNTEVLYFMSEFYSKEHSSGVRFDDPFYNIPWPIPNPTSSDADKNWPMHK